MENDSASMKAQFIENYQLARPIMTIWGDEAEILLMLIKAGGMGVELAIYKRCAISPQYSIS